MRTVVLLIDSFGAGELEDAADFGDKGSNTLLHICQSVSGEKWPHLTRLGLGNMAELLGYIPPGVDPVEVPQAFYGAMKEVSPGKDTTTGHWELMGIRIEEPFTYFPKNFPSFPEGLIKDFLRETGMKNILGNKAASGTKIIEELGEEHQRTGFPIVYTSADSVFQIAAHTDVIPLEELYRLCEAARSLCDPLKVGRVIARPFEGSPGEYRRTEDRKDYSLSYPGESLFDCLQKKGVDTVAVGKTGSIFNEKGFERSYHDKGNRACLDRTEKILKEKSSRDQFIFTNLVDTDMIYGHRRDPEGYFQAVDQIDSRLGRVMDQLEKGDNLIITADHGCDPTFRGTDHTREHIPLLFYVKGSEKGRSLGIRDSFSDLAATLLEAYKAAGNLPGKSFHSELLN